jgi:ATP-dependent DNA helicase RecG
MSGDCLHDPVQFVKGVGPQRAKQLRKLGIETIEDALYYLPFRYEDRSSVQKISHLVQGQLVTVCGDIVSAGVIPIQRKDFRLFELTVTDGSGIMKAKWFNQPYLKKVFKKGQKLFLSGVVKNNPYYGIGLEMDNPDYEFTGNGEDSSIHTSRIVPVYKTISGFGQKTLRTAMFNVIQYAAPELKEYLPAMLIERNSLAGFEKAVLNVHFPEETNVDLELLNSGESKYHKRLIFDELLILHLGVSQLKKGAADHVGITFSCTPDLTDKLRQSLPFRLTSSQSRVIGEIFSDMEKDRPMNRLIQGDVGSGKTIVALMAMLRAVECGFQAALMAPTEILAQQHYLNVSGLLAGLNVRCSLLTSKIKDTEKNPNIIIGTHALIQEGVQFEKLGLVVIDEQHRFGVRQRALLKGKGLNPDVLIMTATPIPRTLALTVYGDMDYSCIDELPPGRTPVETIRIHESEKNKVYKVMDRELKEGGQVYVVYPIIEDDTKMNLRSAELGKEALKHIFPRYRVELVHGKMKPDDRQKVMDEFKAGRIRILVSTTVIEVGVDVAGANVMVIVHAERFGLSQLHQLRGRVGRGRKRSCCILLTYGKPGAEAMKRLSVLEQTSDGFRIAEEDLEIRGPGDFFGTKQSGLQDLKIANIIRDRHLVELTRREADTLLEESPDLEKYPFLRKKVNMMWRNRLEYFNTY